MELFMFPGLSQLEIWACSPTQKVPVAEGRTLQGKDAQAPRGILQVTAPILLTPTTYTSWPAQTQ